MPEASRVFAREPRDRSDFSLRFERSQRAFFANPLLGQGPRLEPVEFGPGQAAIESRRAGPNR